jgi:hypothetical protein
MTYAIIQPPFELTFKERSKEDLKNYWEWFHSALPERITELTRAVNRTPGFHAWKSDATPESLGLLGEWFRGQVETTQETMEESEEVKARLTFLAGLSEEELTIKTFSLAVDVGMYFGQVILKNVPGTRWDQPVRNKNFADYGQPVIMGCGTVPLNPVRIAVTLAYAFAANEQPANRLRALYDVWSAKSTSRNL